MKVENDIADEALDWVNEQTKQKKNLLFLMVGSTSPHFPNDASPVLTTCGRTRVSEASSEVMHLRGASFRSVPGLAHLI